MTRAMSPRLFGLISFIALLAVVALAAVTDQIAGHVVHELDDRSYYAVQVSLAPAVPVEMHGHARLRGKSARTRRARWRFLLPKPRMPTGHICADLLNYLLGQLICLRFRSFRHRPVSASRRAGCSRR